VIGNGDHGPGDGDTVEVGRRDVKGHLERLEDAAREGGAARRLVESFEGIDFQKPVESASERLGEACCGAGIQDHASKVRGAY
jgi:hypothetical protein